jgi:hypothetical protein
LLHILKSTSLTYLKLATKRKMDGLAVTMTPITIRDQMIGVALGETTAVMLQQLVHKDPSQTRIVSRLPFFQN